METQAVILAGGGSRGAYQIGVWQALEELDYRFDFVAGTSVGALNGALMVQGELQTAVKLWEQVTTSDLFSLEIDSAPQTSEQQRETLRQFWEGWKAKKGVDTAPLEALMQKVLDEQKILSSPIDFAFVTVELPSFRPLIVTKQTLPPGQLCDYLLASAACFPAIQSRKIAGKQYIDGGYHSNLPVELAWERGIDHVVAVDLEAPGIVKKAKKTNGQLLTLRSYWDLGPFLLFDPQRSRRNMRLGYLDTHKAMGLLHGFAYAFKGTYFTSQVRRCYEKIRRHSKINLLFVFDKEFFGFNSLSVSRLIRTLFHRKTKELTFSNAILCLAELTGELYGLSPLEIYDFDQFQNRFLAEFESDLTLQPKIEDSLSIKPNLRLRPSPEESRSIVPKLYRLIAQATEMGQPSELPFSLLCAAAPKEFAVAAYLYALKN